MANDLVRLEEVGIASAVVDQWAALPVPVERAGAA
jgi:hypothetical protein